MLNDNELLSLSAIKEFMSDGDSLYCLMENGGVYKMVNDEGWVEIKRGEK